MIHKLPSLNQYKHPTCKWRVSYTATVAGGVPKRLSKTFVKKVDAKTFYDLKLNEYKVWNQFSINELTSLYPALNKWVKFVNKHPHLAELESLEEVVVREVNHLLQKEKSEKLSLVVDDYLQGKLTKYQRRTKQKTDSGEHYRNLKSRYKKLTEYFGEHMLVSDFTKEDAERFITYLFEDLELSHRSVHNIRSSVISLFNHSMKLEYVTKNVFDLTESIDLVDQDIKYYTLEQMEDAWWRSSPECKVAILLQAYCGVRACEYKRMSWDDINIEDNQIIIRAKVGKKNQGRNIVIDEVVSTQLGRLKNLLSADDNDFDSIFDESTSSSEEGEDWIDELLEDGKSSTKVEKSNPVFSVGEREYKKIMDYAFPSRIDNGLRHSFGTYHHTLHHNWLLTTEMMGNSKKVLESHYKNLNCNRSDAEWYFKVIDDSLDADFEVDPRYQAVDIDSHPAMSADEIADYLKEQSVQNHPTQRRLRIQNQHK